ncbi:hypothetical protein TTHERM_00809120 (macronuclear) [Tetrahymena thermophila SB210]|uniref:Uncharacterized protein n=1 Tax=Tetrahymena thermophila (strain SB210) TaxID=312017 RepID=Q233R1_TETTS|nr:hypothetical protein TTHERM_00809120 [Tetrahymena thermophila SB210]EAR91768.2 hypothetical protein TTHERM_00809120 [Tetrahymena thermophila SB210]|eukprot:XP_001012013.2 hypothetical protein TTHERM_00809120 [Tetrahymena thermophila SB210]
MIVIVELLIMNKILFYLFYKWVRINIQICRDIKWTKYKKKFNQKIEKKYLQNTNIILNYKTKNKSYNKNMSKRKQSFSQDKESKKNSEEIKVLEEFIEINVKQEEEQFEEKISKKLKIENQDEQEIKEHKQSQQIQIRQQQQLQILQPRVQSQMGFQIDDKTIQFLIIKLITCFNKSANEKQKIEGYTSLYNYFYAKYESLFSIYFGNNEEKFYNIANSIKKLQDNNIMEVYEQFDEIFNSKIKNIYDNNESLNNSQIQFDMELFERIYEQIISQCPFHCLQQNSWQYENISNSEQAKKASDKFIGIVNSKLEHFANFIIFEKNNIEQQVCSKDKIDVIYFNKDIMPKPQYITENYNVFITRTNFSLIEQLKNNLKLRQISLYFHRENIQKIISDKQKLIGKSLYAQFVFYFQMAILKKLFVKCDFYGVPLTDNELLQKNYIQSIKNIHQLYTKIWSCYLKDMPYPQNKEITPEEYKFAQNFFLANIQAQLNLELFK